MTTRTGTVAPETGQAAVERFLRENERDVPWLARKTGYSVSHLWRVLNEGRRVSPELAEKLAAVIGVPASTFLSEDPR